MPEDFKKECREIGMSMQITSTHKNYFMFVKLDYKLPVSPTDRDAMSAAELELRRRQKKRSNCCVNMCRAANMHTLHGLRRLLVSVVGVA